MIDDDTSPPVACTREDCCRPFSCVCPADEPCHMERLDMIAPRKRPELENPPRG